MPWKPKCCTRTAQEDTGLTFDKPIVVEYIQQQKKIGQDLEYTYVTVASINANIKTLTTQSFVDDVNRNDSITHVFSVAFTSTIDTSKELYILYNNYRYKVVNIINIDENDIILQLRSKVLGNKDIPMNNY